MFVQDDLLIGAVAGAAEALTVALLVAIASCCYLVFGWLSDAAKALRQGRAHRIRVAADLAECRAIAELGTTDHD